MQTPIGRLVLLAVVLGCMFAGCETNHDLTFERIGLEASPVPRSFEFCCDPQVPPPPEGYLVGLIRVRYSPTARGVTQDAEIGLAQSWGGRFPPRELAITLREGSDKVVKPNGDEAVFEVRALACFTKKLTFALEATIHGLNGATSLAYASFDVVWKCPPPPPPPPPGGGGVPTDIAVIAPEAITRFFRALSGGADEVFVAGSNGWALVDASTGATVQDKGLQVGGARYAAAEVADPGTGTIAVCAVGPGGGTLTHWVPAQQQFGGTLLFDGGSNLTDLSPFPDGQGAVIVNFTTGQISLLGFDPATGFFGVRGFPEYIDAFAYTGASGNAVSACTDGSDSRVYFVTDGQPGELYRHEDGARPLGAATLIGNVGNAPRRVRALGNLILVSNFDDDTLSVARVDTLAVVGTIDVGDGPVGIDLKTLGNGDIAVVSTGLNDHTYSITVLTPNGALVSNDKTTLPAGCSAPGHAIWHKDGVLVSCRDTDNLFFAAVP